MAAWNKWTEERFGRVTGRLRKERVEKFCALLNLNSSHKVLDLGSEDGGYLARHYPYPKNIWLADINLEAMQEGVARHGLGGSIPISERGEIPIEDKQFDAVFCNSVIEHVTIDKLAIGTVPQAEFWRSGRMRQKRFAQEIERVGVKYFVQTPNRYFPIEAHSWLPFTQFLPHQAHAKFAKALSSLWIKQWKPDFILYCERQLAEDFPGATDIYKEKVLGLTKSLIAYRI